MNILTCILNKQYITVCKINVFVLRVHVCRTILYSNGVTVFSIVNIFTSQWKCLGYYCFHFKDIFEFLYDIKYYTPIIQYYSVYTQPRTCKEAPLVCATNRSVLQMIFFFSGSKSWKMSYLVPMMARGTSEGSNKSLS